MTKFNEDILNQARELLSKTGKRVTKPRLETFAALVANNKAMSHGELRSLLPDMDRVSLYRSLEWLIEQNLACTIDTSGQHLYISNAHQKPAHHHPHFCCTKCGLSTCLSDSQLSNLEVPEGFKVSEIQLVIKGLCDSCAN